MDSHLDQPAFLHHRRAEESKKRGIVAQSDILAGLSGKRRAHRLLDKLAGIDCFCVRTEPGNISLSKMASITRQPGPQCPPIPFRSAAMPSINVHSPITF
ncbi:hypothetical protein [Mesorhizobium sp.]|uniref:hypothetical protein n=1 Tax=Mesorhizobium sp. TaxID=1871066 RepID=UPI000FE2B19F|nr:hypothetical protein [Mesorhizobium sp.]RWK29814.1 MAG: hypothetical protein EOR40_26555 [Mesorhizobium sp.]RWK91052.1 MAG: hypothetical protein EOR52_05845 [Mesorhizobium sp.]TIP17926.1 MAG: hypothetical protein E5X66_18925 [Mesorhizobium sp.]TJV81327.1 MAG: hypothetical protein E5X45_16890 [Mesorhizobium sp.]TJW17202.1 MAG: hypothetical protein E5X42_16065 [Mesorhizobium sp.]